VGAIHESVTEFVLAGATVTVKAASDVDALPSLTVMAMFANVPVPAGVPYSVPLELSNVAQAGLFVMLNVSRSPSASDAVGLNEYGCRTVAVFAGVPLMTGARFVVVGLTAIEKAGSETLVVPSDTVITTLE
jgi:hypothetical protein